MDQDAPRHEEDLSEVERRLTGWRPAVGNVDADAMLFAAGRAAGLHGRRALLWPALCALLLLQAAALGAWGLSERTERLTLADRLRDAVQASHVLPSFVDAGLPESSYTASPNDYFHLRRREEQDPGRWLAALQSEGTPPPGPRPRPAILSAGQRDRLIDR